MITGRRVVVCGSELGEVPLGERQNHRPVQQNFHDLDVWQRRIFSVNGASSMSYSSLELIAACPCQSDPCCCFCLDVGACVHKNAPIENSIVCLNLLPAASTTVNNPESGVHG